VTPPLPPSPETPAAPRHRGGFASRATFGFLLGATFAGLVWADDVAFAAGMPAGCCLLPVALLAAVLGAHEAGAIAATHGRREQFTTAMLGAATIVVAGFFGLRGQAWASAFDPVPIAVCIAIALPFAVEIVGYRAGGGALERAAAGSLAAVCVGLPIAFMLGLRRLWCDESWAEQRGPHHVCTLLPLVSFMIVVKAGDIVAYLVGSSIGRNRLAPVLSPGKTWEGALAGLAGSLAAAWLVLDVVRPAWFPDRGLTSPWGGWPAYGLLLGLAGIVGDLCESLVKRERGVKDSGRWLGGLGGVLDLVDSLLLAAPVAWLLWVVARSP
jgi:phosphatidate cytidylyltransferase